MKTVVCPKCQELTGYKTDGRILFDHQGEALNKAAAGFFLIQGYRCPSCGASVWWSADNKENGKNENRENNRQV